MRQTPVNEHEFAGEEQARDDPGTQRAIGAEKSNAAQARPGEEQHGRDDRAQRRLHHQRHVGGDPLHRHLLEAPRRR